MPGRDRGIDIVAYPDALGLGSPRIKAQVKHRKDAASGPEMRSFLGALRGDRGLYISTSGYTNEARIEADHASTTVSLLDRDDFIRIFLEHYDNLESEYKALVPLRRIWIPTT
ncbi:MAG: restriction endonuclease [Chloroflexi bacterium]|nr:restriction endonuclease [Chloroflexota bacterium]